MNSIEIRKLELKDINSVFNLYERAFGHEEMERWKKRWHWQFFGNPGAESASPGLWVAMTENGNIVGFIGSMPVKMKIGQQEILAYSSSDLMVSSEVRRQGLAKRLIKSYLDNVQLFAAAFSNAPVTEKTLMSLGYQPVYSEPIYIRPYNMSSILQFIIDSGRIPHFLSNRPIRWLIKSIGAFLSNIVAIMNKLKYPKYSREYSIEKAIGINSEFDALWERLSYHFPIIIVRDRKFLQWRFMEDPGFEHTLLVARDKRGLLCGYIDFCISKRRKMLVGRIMDLLCQPESGGLIDSLLRGSMELMEEKRLT